jgi:hypothetical protein
MLVYKSVMLRKNTLNKSLHMQLLQGFEEKYVIIKNIIV